MGTAQKKKFSIKDIFSKCDQIRRKLGIWSHLLKKSLMENFTFCAVGFEPSQCYLKAYGKLFCQSLEDIYKPGEVLKDVSLCRYPDWLVVFFCSNPLLVSQKLITANIKSSSKKQFIFNQMIMPGGGKILSGNSSGITCAANKNTKQSP